MISGISYGTYLIFGILTFTGAAFVWYYVPETKRLTLEEMDVIFERMTEINREIGLDAILGRGDTSGGSGLEHEHEKELEKEGHVE
jgi:hypothetical protein